MISDTLQGVRERRGRRWFLVVPLALFAAFGMLLWTLPPVFLTMNGAVLAFFPCYLMVVVAATVAPAHKTITAALLAIFAIMLWYPWTSPDGDPDELSPHAVWIGAIVGCILALVLVARRVRPRWLLIIPAYLVGFDLLFVPTACLSSFLIPQQAYFPFVTAAVSSIGGIAITGWLAPGYKQRTRIAACLASSAFVFLTWYQW